MLFSGVNDLEDNWQPMSSSSLVIYSVLVTKLKQEGWLSPTECASVSAISLRHIIWLPHESNAGMSLPSFIRLVQAFGSVKRV